MLQSAQSAADEIPPHHSPSTMMSAVVGAFVSVLPHLAIGGAVIPDLGLLESGKLEYDHAFDGRTLEYLLATIVPCQRGRDFLRVGVKLRLVAGSLAREDYIGDHVLLLLFLFFRAGSID